MCQCESCGGGGGAPRASPKDSDGEKVCQNPNPGISSSQKFYIFTIYNVQIMSERMTVVAVHVWSDEALSYSGGGEPRIHFDMFLNVQGNALGYNKMTCMWIRHIITEHPKLVYSSFLLQK